MKSIKIVEINPQQGLQPKLEEKEFMVILTQDGTVYSGKTKGVAVNALMRTGGMRTQIFGDGRARVEGIDGDLHE